MCELALGFRGKRQRHRTPNADFQTHKIFFKCVLNFQEIPWPPSRQLSNSQKLKAVTVETFSITCLLKKIQCKTSENVNIMNYTGADREDLLNCSAHLSASTGFFLIAIYDDCEQPCTSKLCFLSLPMPAYSQPHFEMFPNIPSIVFFTDFIISSIYIPLLHHIILSAFLQNLHNTNNFTISIA